MKRLAGVVLVAALACAGLGLVAAAAAGCGAQADVLARSRGALAGALVATDQARQAFDAWDTRHQHEIVLKATSLESGQAALVAWRSRRQPVLEAFIAAYLAIGGAATALLVAEQAKSVSADLIARLKAVADTYVRLTRAVRAVGGGGS